MIILINIYSGKWQNYIRQSLHIYTIHCLLNIDITFHKDRCWLKDPNCIPSDQSRLKIHFSLKYSIHTNCVSEFYRTFGVLNLKTIKHSTRS